MSGEMPSDPYCARKLREESAAADEEALFAVWFALYRVKQWRKSRPDRAHEEPSEAFCMGLRDNFHTGWMARATIHVTPVRDL
jgi:hypothetical protein